MKKEIVISHFGSVQKVADILEVSHAAVSKWPDELTNAIFHRVMGAALDKGIRVPIEWISSRKKVA